MTLKTFFDNFEVLTDAPNAVVKLRKIILELAVRGQLVPQEPDDEPASVLLKRIRAHRKQIVEIKKKSKNKTTSSY